jgi:hypothetical protein
LVPHHSKFSLRVKSANKFSLPLYTQLSGSDNKIYLVIWSSTFTMQNMFHPFIEFICWLHTTSKKLFASTKLVFVIEALNISCELDMIGFMNLSKFQTTNTHKITQYNLSHKILGQFICDECVPIRHIMSHRC